MTENQKLRKLIGERIRKVRLHRGMTQEECAKYIGITPSYLCYMEGGRNSPNANTLITVCRGLGISADYILGLANSLEIAIGQTYVETELIGNFDRLTKHEQEIISEFVKHLAAKRSEKS